jgi:DNA-binding HxlR family transcriptional regulator
MKLEKVTKESGRRYHDACGAAHALDLVGERWALLVMRELMYGPRRFGDLRAALVGISANVLTQRLEGLEESGIVRKRKLPPPASVQVYELTDWGAEAEPIFQSLGRWAARSPRHDPTLPISAISIMMSLRTMLAQGRIGDFALTVGFRFGDDEFVARLKDGELPIEREPIGEVDVRVEGEPAALAAVVYGGAPLSMLTVTGDVAGFQRFIGLFDLPPKAEAA